MRAVIVTGVSRGLGEAMAVALLEQGCTVLGVGRSASPRLAGDRYRHATCDLSRPGEIEAAVLPPLRALAAERPAAVTLVNNAAVVTPVGRIGRLAGDEIGVACATNVAAPLVMADLLCRAFPDPAMPRRIVNISSGAAHSAIAGSAAYCMSKAALEMLTRALVADHAGTALESVTLRPGIFETGMQQLMRSQDPAEFPSAGLFRGFKDKGLLKDPADVARRIVARLVLGAVENGRTYAHTDLDD